MKLTEIEEKIARLALDPAAKDGERAAAAKKLIESLHRRGVRVEDIQKEEVQTEYVYSDPPPPPRPRRTDAPWDPDPEVRRRNYEAADEAGYRWDRQYGYTPPPPPPETKEEKAAREESWRRQNAARERYEQEEAAREAAQLAQAQARERARKAKEAAWPWHTKAAVGLGRALGPYSKQSYYRMANPGAVNGKFENGANTVFGYVLLVLLLLLAVTAVVAAVYYHPIVSLTILVVIFISFYCYCLSHQRD